MIKSDSPRSRSDSSFSGLHLSQTRLSSNSPASQFTITTLLPAALVSGASIGTSPEITRLPRVAFMIATTSETKKDARNSLGGGRQGAGRTGADPREGICCFDAAFSAAADRYGHGDATRDVLGTETRYFTNIAPRKRGIIKASVDDRNPESGMQRRDAGRGRETSSVSCPGRRGRS